MLSMQLQLRGLSELTRTVMDLPGDFARAKLAAMKSVGWLGMTTLRNHVEYGPPGWDPLHALTAKFYKGRGKRSSLWIKRQKPPYSPDQWLGKFARYRVSKTGSVVQLDFGKGKRGQQNPGRLDPQLATIARRVDSGEKLTVTLKMRKKLAATYQRAKKAMAGGAEPVPGVDFFPLKKSTTTITTPARPIFGPVKNKLDSQVGPWFEERFWKNYYGRKR